MSGRHSGHYRERVGTGLKTAGALLALAAVTLSPAASAKRFCYYWVDDGGNADTFETPPIDMEAPPFPRSGALNGHLVVAMTRDSCRRSVFKSQPIEPRAGRSARSTIETPEGAQIGPGEAPQQDQPPTQ